MYIMLNYNLIIVVCSNTEIKAHLHDWPIHEPQHTPAAKLMFSSAIERFC